MTFSELMEAANASKHPRPPGQWTPLACQIWREAEPEMSRRMEAALAWELSNGRIASRKTRQRMDEATAAAVVKG